MESFISSITNLLGSLKAVFGPLVIMDRDCPFNVPKVSIIFLLMRQPLYKRGCIGSKKHHRFPPALVPKQCLNDPTGTSIESHGRQFLL
jgi:hypothetical protein